MDTEDRLDGGEHTSRVRRAQEIMSRESIDFLFVPVSVNLKYLTGIDVSKSERLTAALIPATGEPLIICPAFERERIAGSIPYNNIHIWEEDESPYRIIGDIISSEHFDSPSIAVEPKTWFEEYSKLSEYVNDANFEKASYIFEELRIIKSSLEIGYIKEAIGIISEAREEILKSVEKGMTQTQLMENLREEAKKCSSSEELLGSINVGENTSIPHGSSEDKVVKDGSVIMIDTGVRVNGYVSDITRTTSYGSPPEELEDIFQVLTLAREKAFDLIKPGVKAREIDRAARKEIEKSGYGEYFTHRLGHGIGLEIHERPWIAPGNEEEIREGMVFTIEPGIYLPGKFGVRIEENVMVTRTGYVCLSDKPENFKSL